jgi:tetrapyrrole methylase family protein/MazG family protein
MHPVTVVGLGPGEARHLTLAARNALREARTVWLRTDRHPAAAVARALAAPDAAVGSCDDLYEAHRTFGEVYRAIVQRVVESAAGGPVVYAVPGDPSVGEAAVGSLREAARAAGVPLEVVPGVSFLEPTLAALGWDGLDLQVADATALAARHHPDLDPDRPALVAQLYGRLLASDLKLVLLGQYPADHEVTLVAGAGAPGGARLDARPLAELDHDDVADDLTTLAVPPLAAPGSVQSLADVVARLRAPDGCPWDREQTHLTLRPYLLEEAYEVLAALDAEDPAALGEELGDLLLQIVLHARLATESGDFTLPDVVAGITDKLVRRHPHVFGDVRADTAAEVRANWEALKRAERADGAVVEPFEGVPAALPALARAQAVQRRGRAIRPPAGDAGGVAEAADAVAALGRAGDAADEEGWARAVGRALWSIATWAEGHGVDAEVALRAATADYEAEVRGAVPVDGARNGRPEEGDG